jgi:hypothetical protein
VLHLALGVLVQEEGTPYHQQQPLDLHEEPHQQAPHQAAAACRGFPVGNPLDLQNSGNAWMVGMVVVISNYEKLLQMYIKWFWLLTTVPVRDVVKR